MSVFFQAGSSCRCLSRASPFSASRPRAAFRAVAIAKHFHTTEHPTEPLYNATEETILGAALKHVPEHGFSLEAISQGALETGHLDVTRNLFPRGAFDLVRYFQAVERLKLEHSFKALQSEEEIKGTGARIEGLVKLRLAGNLPVQSQLQNMLAVMAQPRNIPGSLEQLHALSDEIWHLASTPEDAAKSSNMSWYTKRASLSAIYASTELFMAQDTSPDCQDTYAFLKRRLRDLYLFSSSVSEASRFIGFQLWQARNIAASKGLRF